MMKGRKELARGVIDEVKHKFENKRANEVKRFHTNSITVKRKLFVNGEDEVWIHVYYKAGKFAAEKEEMDTDLDEAKKALDRHLQKEFRPTSFIQQYYDLYYSKDEEGKEVLTAYAEKTEAIDKERDYLGYYMIVTSEEMTAGEALTLYKSRDAQEKLFRGDKSFTSGKAYRVHSEGSLEAKIFIEFIVMIIRNRIYLSLLDEEERNGTDLNYMNVTAALRQLEKIQMVRERRSQYHLDSALTKIQKNILKAFGLNQGNVKDLIRELNKRIPEVSGLIPITM